MTNAADDVGAPLLAWAARGAAAGAFAAAAVQLLELMIRQLDVSLGDALRAALVLGLIGALLGGLAGVTLFCLRRVGGWSTDAVAQRRLASSLRAGIFVLLAGAMLSLANGQSLQFDSIVSLTRWMLAGIALSSSLACIAGWRCGGAGSAMLGRPLWTADILGSLWAIALVTATTFAAPVAWSIGLGVSALIAFALLRSQSFGKTLSLAGVAVLAALVAFELAPEDVPSATGTPKPAPNSLVLIVLDTQRADHLGPYGGLAGSTPAIDQLAAEGTLFEDVISPSPWTLPSHASMFTGLYPSQHRCWFGDQRWLPDEVETVAERLRDRGFETRALLSNGYLMLANVLQGFDSKIGTFGDVERLMATTVMRYTGLGFERWIDKGAAQTLHELDDWLRSRDSAQPFFLFINLFEVHELYQPPIADRELPPAANAWDVVNATRRFDSTRWHSLHRDAGMHEDVIRSLYQSEVRYQDRLLGEILRILDAHVDRADVAVVLTADHGDNLGDGGRWGHLFALNDALVQVPLVVRAPGRMAAGERVSGTVSTLDLAPTLLELAGQPGSLGEGHSLVPDGRRSRTATFAEVFPDYPRIARTSIAIKQPIAEFQWGLAAIRKDDLKLVVPEHGPAMLYDLVADPREEKDVAAERPEEVALLRSELDAWRREHPRSEEARTGETEELDEETRRRLKALGYL